MLARSVRAMATQSGWAGPRARSAHSRALCAKHAACAAQAAVFEAGFGQPLASERADAVEQAVADQSVLVLSDGDQRPVDEPVDDVGRGRFGDIQRFQDPLGGGQGGTVDEAGQGPQAALVVREEQVVAPSDRCRQSPAPCWSSAGRVAQQPEPVVEAVGDLAHRERPDTSRRELDRQWKPVQGPTDLLDGRRGLLVEHEPAVGEALRTNSVVESDSGMGPQVVDDLPVHAERHLAGRQYS